ncbi:protein PHLOEM PROTEIN 2-LIKE A1 [Pyrus x bretschneideri]|uniref:protein PHLOEM PROTEIN 2-LIKE A1 n=1 Tax=Pyrus x bretschneideri TaxID=225117 RepID=UPI00202E75CF|nr:protein PHLOEM PROTEIN 2-LIKE A1 [Pyrus x bretschneideri]
MIEELHEEMDQAAKTSFPHKYQDILREFNARIDTSSPEKFHSELGETGIFDQQKKHRYWVDEKGKNCFMVYARALRIAWSGNRRQWRWYTERANNSDVSVEVAELLRAYWLEVHGFFETGYLTPDTKYEVSYVIKMKEPSSGWEDNVDFSLTLPQNTMRGLNINKKNLKQISREDWSYIRVDEFTPGQSGKMDFMLRQPGRLKTGLVIKGVAIRPTT